MTSISATWVTIGNAEVSSSQNTIKQPWPFTIGAKPNLYCEAIELVCGGSPNVCILVERKAWHRVKSEQWQLKSVWISCLYSTSVQSWMKSMETICSSHKSLYMAFPLYEAHQIRRDAAGEPTLLE